jgi:rubrerythrin
MEFVTLEEIIKFAVQREEIAYQLYTDAAAKSTSISAHKMFEEIRSTFRLRSGTFRSLSGVEA